MDTSLKVLPKLINFIALGAFGWTRRSEVCVLEWEKFRDDDTLFITSDKTKTRKNRFIPINDTLKNWLEVAPKMSRPTSSVNADVMGDKLATLAKKAGIEMPHNALRHSAISYALASPPMFSKKPMINTMGEVAKWAGNSESVITKSYRHLVTQSDGKAYWKILP